MILESLVNYYEALVECGVLSKPGWSQVDVTYALDIDIEGNLKRVISLKIQDENSRFVSQKKTLPTPEKRSSGIAPNFLCDNSSYFLGIDNKGKPERSKECFFAAKELHEKSMPEGESVTVAVTNFFRRWDAEKADECGALQEFKNEIIKGGNIVFLYDGKFVHEYTSVQDRWQSIYQSDDSEQVMCSVTGAKDSLAILHPNIKRIKNAQSSGASLVSFNAPAFSSYGKEKGANAQTGKYAAFAYGEALNYLTESLSYKHYIGNTALLFYAVSSERIYQDIFSAFYLGNSEKYSENDLLTVVDEICQGNVAYFDEQQVDPNMEFYLLGIAPNNARLSIRFFEKGTFGSFVNNIRAHQERLRIGPEKERESIIPIWKILKETCREGADVSPILAGELTRSIIGNTRYPSTLINAIDLRIKVDGKIDSRRAGIIKAYYLKNINPQIPKEVLTMGLNTETDNAPYNLGRLFAILEKIQETASPELNATIKDKYFSGASSTPATIMPKLIDLAQKHLRKLEAGRKIIFSKQLGEILNKFETGYPKLLSMPERGAFQLGYYHQMQEFYRSKKAEEK